MSIPLLPFCIMPGALGPCRLPQLRVKSRSIACDLVNPCRESCHEILAKPRPQYSAEALKLNLEGEGLLDVIFPASGGMVHVNRVVKGLGHGLDEAAIKAAEQIKYKPAISNGHPVDFPAVIHIVFQTAY